MLVTSEMMRSGVEPLLFTGGACNITTPTGPVHNHGRDRLANWLDDKGWSYFEPQIHPDTHGREYVWELDGPYEKKARERAKLRIYEIAPSTISSISVLEAMEDAWQGRTSIVWFDGAKNFVPLGLGDRDDVRGNEALRREVGETAYYHLLAYVTAGRHLRMEIQVMLEHCETIVFVESFEELKDTVCELLPKLCQAG